MAWHDEITGADNHVIHAFTYADTAAREGASGLTAADVGKVARQSDDKTYWVLETNSPVKWSPLTGVVEGTVKVGVSVRGDVVSGSSGGATVSTNNNMAALKLYHDTNEDGTGTETDGESRWAMPVPQNYISGGIKMRLYYTWATAPGNGNKKVRLRFGYNLITTGDALGSYTNIDLTKDVAGEAVDTIQSVEVGTLPHASVNLAKNLFFLMVSRLGTHTDDTVNESMYIHRVELEYTGLISKGISLHW